MVVKYVITKKCISTSSFHILIVDVTEKTLFYFTLSSKMLIAEYHLNTCVNICVRLNYSLVVPMSIFHPYGELPLLISTQNDAINIQATYSHKISL